MAVRTAILVTKLCFCYVVADKFRQVILPALGAKYIFCCTLDMLIALWQNKICRQVGDVRPFRPIHKMYLFLRYGGQARQPLPQS